MHVAIGEFEGQAHGPLVIAIGGIHGNEPAGVLAIAEAFRILHAWRYPKRFCFQGYFYRADGNLHAFSEGRRFIQEDLNRAWTYTKVARASLAMPLSSQAENKQIRGTWRDDKKAGQCVSRARSYCLTCIPPLRRAVFFGIPMTKAPV